MPNSNQGIVGYGQDSLGIEWLSVPYLPRQHVLPKCTPCYVDSGCIRKARLLSSKVLPRSVDSDDGSCMHLPQISRVYVRAWTKCGD